MRYRFVFDRTPTLCSRTLTSAERIRLRIRAAFCFTELEKRSLLPRTDFSDSTS